MSLVTHRPLGSDRRSEPYFSKLTKELARRLGKAQPELAYETLRLPPRELRELAAVLVEFAEDVHYDIGLWRSLEAYNRAFFGVPLPLVAPVGETDPAGLMEYRLRYLLWTLYGEMNPDLLLSPTHQDLARLAAWSADFLAERLAKAPAESAVKEFLAQPNRWGWDVKRKLVWLGWHSYLFRYPCQNYIDERGGQASIGVIDDFVCQATTAWSGLGAIDILAATLKINDERRAELRSWYERHVAYYRVRAVKRDGLDVVNLINDRPYTIEMERPEDFCKTDEVIFGSLTPWDGRWYWSGEQKNLGRLPQSTVQELKQEFLRRAALVAYRYDERLLARARESLRNMYDKFVAYHGSDLVVFPNGLTMAASLQKMYRIYNEAMLAEAGETVKKAPNLTSAASKMPYPDELLKSDNGVAVYFDRDEGQEIIIEYNHLVKGLQKKGQDLSEDEAWAIRSLIESPVISPAFVQRVVQEHGAEAIAAVYLVRQPEDKPYLAYLLRRYKGEFYRKRYPNVTVI